MSKRKSLTMKEKAEIVARMEKDATNTQICKELSLTSSTVSTIWKNRDQIKESFSSHNAKAKRHRGTQFEDVDEAVLTWFKTQQSANVPINGPIMEEKAKQYAKSLGYTSEPDHSWVQRFRKRHTIVFGKISGESSSAPVESKEEWLETVWPNIREGYSDDEIYNADETGLFYKLTPDRTFKFKGENCSGGKLSKERITVMVTANMSGNDKKKLLVIGKSKNPRCFKHTATSRLPVTYKNSKKAWMTSPIFEEYLQDCDKELEKEKKKILLLVDNCPAHPAVRGLKNIKLYFLPANTTSILQPMDQGVIKSLKVKFRKQLILRMIKTIENGDGNDINVLEAIIMVSKAWAGVSATTTRNCFRHAGLESASNEPPPDDEDIDINLWAQDLALPQSLLMEDLNEYVSVDDDLRVTTEMSDEEILSAVRKDDQDAGTQNESDDEEEAPPPPSFQDASRAVADLYRYFGSKADVPGDVDVAISRIEQYLDTDFCNQRKKQAKLTDYFTRE